MPVQMGALARRNASVAMPSVSPFPTGRQPPQKLPEPALTWYRIDPPPGIATLQEARGWGGGRARRSPRRAGSSTGGSLANMQVVTPRPGDAEGHADGDARHDHHRGGHGAPEPAALPQRLLRR